MSEQNGRETLLMARMGYESLSGGYWCCMDLLGWVPRYDTPLRLWRELSLLILL